MKEEHSCRVLPLSSSSLDHADAGIDISHSGWDYAMHVLVIEGSLVPIYRYIRSEGPTWFFPSLSVR